MLALPRVSTSLAVIAELRKAGYCGPIASIARYPDEVQELEEAGIESTFNIFSEAGAGFAAHVLDTYDEDDESDRVL